MPNDPSQAPEIYLFGLTHLNTPHLQQLLDISSRAAGDMFIVIVELSNIEEEQRITAHVAASDHLCLLSVEAFINLDSEALAGGPTTTAVHRQFCNTYGAYLLSTTVCNNNDNHHERTTGSAGNDNAAQLTNILPPWMEPGFPAVARKWIVCSLSDTLPSHAVHVSTVRSWCLSCVAIVTDSRDENRFHRWFFKASPRRMSSSSFPETAYDRLVAARCGGTSGGHDSLFGRDAAISQYLHEHFPGLAPACVAACEHRGFTLCNAMGGVLDRQREVYNDTALLNVFVENYVLLQRSVAPPSSDRDAGGPSVDAMLGNGGFSDRRLCKLAYQLRRAVSAAEMTLTELPPVPDGFYQHVAKVCDEVDAEAGTVKATLVHSDMHGSNIVYDGKRIAVIDWTEAAVSHPILEAHEMPGRIAGLYLEHMGIDKRTWRKSKILGECTAFVIYSYLCQLPPKNEHFANVARRKLAQAVREFEVANDRMGPEQDC